MYDPRLPETRVDKRFQRERIKLTRGVFDDCLDLDGGRANPRTSPRETAEISPEPESRRSGIDERRAVLVGHAYDGLPCLDRLQFENPSA